MAFEDLTFDDLISLINDLKDEGAEASRAFFDGDHWQSSNAWIGPRPSITESGASDTLLEIERGLVSKNAVKEVVERHQAGVIGREPGWTLTLRRPLGVVVDEDGNELDEEPSESEQALIAEAEAALVEWWDKRKCLNLIKKSVTNLLTGGRGILRVFVPRGLLADNNSVPAGDLLKQLDRIYLSVPDPDQATVTKDEETQQEAGIFSYEEKRGDDTKKFVEFSFPLNGFTLIRVVSEGGETLDAPLDLDSHLTLYEMESDPLITEQVRQNQALLNMARTMMGRNVVLGGFLERVFLNAQMPGDYTTNERGEKTFVPNPFYVGAGTTNFMVGATQVDSEGNETIANPSVVYRDPVRIDTFEATASAAYKAILEECKQLHALIAGDATASGESRKQAMDDFRKSLGPTKAQIDACGRWLLETVLEMASQFSGQAGRFRELRASFDAQIDVGELSADERRLLIEEVKAELRPRENTMTLLGSDDPDAWVQQIATEKETLNPMSVIQRKRAEINLGRDREAADGGIAARIEGAAQTSEALQ